MIDLAITKDKAFVTFEDLKNYTNALKEYVDSKILPVPSDCEQLSPTIYDTGTTMIIAGWGLPTGFSDAIAGTTYEYFFVEDNKIVGRCLALRDTKGIYNLTWLDGTSSPASLTFYTTESQAEAWGVCCGFQILFSPVTLTASATTVGSNMKVNVVTTGSLKPLLLGVGRYSVYARKLA